MPRLRPECAARMWLFRWEGPWRLNPLAQGFVKPGPGIGPVTVSSAPGHSQGGRRLFQAQSGKEAKLDQLGARLVLARQPFQRLVKIDQLVIGGIVGDGQAVHVRSLPAAAAFEPILVS